MSEQAKSDAQQRTLRGLGRQGDGEGAARPRGRVVSAFRHRTSAANGLLPSCAQEGAPVTVVDAGMASKLREGRSEKLSEETLGLWTDGVLAVLFSLVRRGKTVGGKGVLRAVADLG